MVKTVKNGYNGKKRLKNGKKRLKNGKKRLKMVKTVQKT